LQAFDIHKSVVEDYKNYLNRFTLIKDPRIREKVDEAFAKGLFLPQALVQFNPSFKRGESLEDLTRQNLVHPDLKAIIGTYHLYYHQVEEVKKFYEQKGKVVPAGILYSDKQVKGKKKGKEGDGTVNEPDGHYGGLFD